MSKQRSDIADASIWVSPATREQFDKLQDQMSAEHGERLNKDHVLKVIIDHWIMCEEGIITTL